MKNIFKYLSVFAIAGTIGLQSINAVQVEQCGEDEEVHTNYYMFLEADPVDGLKEALANATEAFPVSMYTGADKYNNIKLANFLNGGQITITATGQSSDGDVEKTWSVADYWRKYYTAYDAKDNNGMYTSGNTHYFFHEAWYVYEDDQFIGGDEMNYASATQHSTLMSYISNNFSNLESTELVTTGTMLPYTNIKRPETVFTDANTSDRWNIARSYRSSSVPAGVPLNGARYVYAPAAYFIRWCGPKTTSSSNKTVTYNSNTTDKVTNMPDNQEFSDECVTLQSKKPTREGYTFIGWGKTSTQTTADYAPNDQYCGNSITLYAIWVENQTGPFTITYDANGGKDAPASQSGAAGECLTISSQKPTLAGNTFVGWSRDPKSAVPDDSFTPGTGKYCGELGNITLYAIYRADTGVSAHMIAFAAIALAAVGALLVAKKKDLFKQI